MAKVTVEGRFLRRIDDYVLYKLDDQIIMRANSGFTSKALKTSPKYALSRQNASEFGRVSATCKAIRVALQLYLPKKNNLAVVNSLTKRMRQLLVYDTESVRGERTLARAMATELAQKEFKKYHFNPDAAVNLVYQMDCKQVQFVTSGLCFPDGATSVCCTVLSFAFDFDTKESSVVSSAPSFFSAATLPDTLVLAVPSLEGYSGTLFTILVVSFYSVLDGGYVPLEDDRSNMVVILG